MSQEVDAVVTEAKLEVLTQAMVMVVVEATRVSKIPRIQLGIATTIPVETIARGLLPLLV